MGFIERRKEPGSAADADVVAQAALAFDEVLAGLRRTLDLADRRTANEMAVAWLQRGDRLLQGLRACAGDAVLVSIAIEPLPLLCSLANVLYETLDRRIHVSVDVDKDCPACHADYDALNDALLHFVRNACASMPEGGQLTLIAAPAWLADGSAAVRFAVSDSGIGMTADVATMAVGPFFPSTKGDPSRGLGLAAVDGFARQSGGSFELRYLGAGTTASILLPEDPVSTRPFRRPVALGQDLVS